MKQILFVVICLFVGFHARADQPSLHACHAITDWLKGYSGADICEAGGGSFCSSVENVGQGICEGGGGHFCSSVQNAGQGICEALDGSFCSSVKNDAQGICRGLGETDCDSLTDQDDAAWTDRIANTCGYNGGWND